jgi:hypothetical protein
MAYSYKRSLSSLSRSPLVGLDLRAWHRFWTGYPETMPLINRPSEVKESAFRMDDTALITDPSGALCAQPICNFAFRSGSLRVPCNRCSNYSKFSIAQMSPPCGRKRSKSTHLPSEDHTG